ncbi:hypothetical protein [Sinorhizobium meliloti]|uniref:hypothetical protein n=1 Tax=Rhizobium meliloti TaxID=382 RepID=UPI000FDC10B3|nr:hypothetical protein [Sinorhizobium meliloti]RVQ01548.1 hypothetical protein CN070_12035 [Sinorhizobium meliloti]
MLGRAFAQLLEERQVPNCGDKAEILKTDAAFPNAAGGTIGRTERSRPEHSRENCVPSGVEMPGCAGTGLIQIKLTVTGIGDLLRRCLPRFARIQLAMMGDG